MRDQIFISYSRDQLYYAESIVHALQDLKFNIWFDLQQLEPGTAWASEIESGLKESSRLILIVSRSSLASPYVAIEWMHALDRHKPIYLVLFEEVEFQPFTMPFHGEGMLVPLDQLRLKAKAIIDGRGNFENTTKRLGDSLASPVKYRDPIPPVNRFKIPRRLPYPVAFVAGTMAILSGLALYLTLTIFSAFLPMLLAGCIVTAYCGFQAWEFLQRKSYQGTRVVLMAAPPIIFFFAHWFTYLVLAALYIAIYSDDVHRWSPRGEGNNPRNLVQIRKRPRWQKVLRFLLFIPLLYFFPLLLWLVLIISFFVRNRNVYEAHRRGEMVIVLLILSTLLLLIEPFITLPLIVILTALAHRRQRPLAAPGSVANVTYKIHAHLEDTLIVEDLHNAFAYVGLKRYEPSPKSPGYHIVVVSNFGPPPEIESLQAAGGKIVVVVASTLSDWEGLEPYTGYQWVDYRSQDPERLVAMGQDLKAGRESNSFYNRVVPQSFERLVVPGRVYLFILVQLIIFAVSIFGLTRDTVTGKYHYPTLVVSSALMLGLSFWILDHILGRRITVLGLVQLNVGLAFVSSFINWAVSMLQPALPGSAGARETGYGWLLFNVILAIIFYRFGAYEMSAILKWWLPPDSPVGKSRPNRRLALGILGLTVLTVLLTVSFFGNDIPLSHKRLSLNQIHFKRAFILGNLSLDVPDHWREIPAGIRDDEITLYILNVPISAVLLKANNPLNPFLAVAINSYMKSPFQGSWFIRTMFSSGHDIERIFETIAFSLPDGDPSKSPWRPDHYGSPAYTLVYVPDGKVEDTLIITIWSYSANPHIVPSVNAVATDARIAPNTRLIEPSLLTPGITAFHSEVTSVQMKDPPEKTIVIVSLDSSGEDHFVVLSGNRRVLEENKLILEHILESIRIPEP